MKKRTYLRLRLLVLLVIYLISNSPGVLHHHHEVELAFFQQADACEKAVYFADPSGHCEHKAHFSEAEERCSLCDHHTFSPQALQFFEPNSQKNGINNKIAALDKSYFYQAFSDLSNRRPNSFITDDLMVSPMFAQ